MSAYQDRVARSSESAIQQWVAQTTITGPVSGADLWHDFVEWSGSDLRIMSCDTFLCRLLLGGYAEATFTVVAR